jgi:hypothetical protein
MEQTDNSGVGLTVKQLLLEIRADLKALRETLLNKVDRPEFDMLKSKVDDMAAGKITSPYGQQLMLEYGNLKGDVAALKSFKERAALVDEINKKTAIQAAATRRWVIGLAGAVILQLFAVIAKVFFNI